MISPQIFVSYAREDERYVERVEKDLRNSQVSCWIDKIGIQAGDRLNPVIESAISESSLFFAYVTKAYLDSHWCRKELQFALRARRVTVMPYVDSEATLRAVPRELMDEVSFGVLESDNYAGFLLRLAGSAWASLQTFQRVVPSEDHILAGPAIFDSAGYSRSDLMKRTKRHLILAGPNLRSWMTDQASKQGLVDLVKNSKKKRVTLILATYETLGAVSPEGEIHLRHSVRDIQEMVGRLEGEERRRMSVYFHVGASTLSAVFIDPEAADGVLFFSPRWAIQYVPQDRLTCIIDKKINSEALFKALHNSVLLMTQGDAKTIEDMVAEL